MSGHCAFSALSFAAVGLVAAVVSATAFSTSARTRRGAGGVLNRLA